MARNALANLEDWDPSCFSPELAPDVAALLAVIVEQEGGKAHLDVSAPALHRQVQHRIRDIQSRLRDEGDQAGRKSAEGARQLILEAWPAIGASATEGSGDVEARAETEAGADHARLLAQQALDDASSRGVTVNEKCLKLLSEASEFLDLPAEPSPSDLTAAIARIESILDLHASRLADTAPLEDWFAEHEIDPSLLRLVDLAPGPEELQGARAAEPSEQARKSAQDRTIERFFDPVLEEIVKADVLRSEPMEGDCFRIPVDPFTTNPPRHWIDGELRAELQDDMQVYNRTCEKIGHQARRREARDPASSRFEPCALPHSKAAQTVSAQQPDPAQQARHSRLGPREHFPLGSSSSHGARSKVEDCASEFAVRLWLHRRSGLQTIRGGCDRTDR